MEVACFKEGAITQLEGIRDFSSRELDALSSGGVLPTKYIVESYLRD